MGVFLYMGKREKINIIMSIPLVVISCAVILILCRSMCEKNNFDYLSLLIAGCDVLTSATAGAFIVYQLKKDGDSELEKKEIQQASFILEYNRSFIENADMAYVERYLENYINDVGQGKFDLENKNRNDRQKLINYLVYLEGLSSCILGGGLDLDSVDNLFAYRYFLAMNNPVVQQIELLPFGDYYRGCFKLYDLWYRYREIKWSTIPDYGIPLQCFSLNRCSGYERYIDNPIFVERFLKFSNITEYHARNEEKKELGKLIINDRNITYEECFERTGKVRRILYQHAVQCKQLTHKDQLKQEQLEDIARLIFLTDEFIYPAIFSTETNAEKILPILLSRNEDTMFNLENLYVAYLGNRIVGIVLWKKGELVWTTDRLEQIAEEEKVRLSSNLELVKEDYIKKNYENVISERLSIINFCIEPRFRGLGIGEKLLKEFICQNINFDMELCVLRKNISAIRLYERQGFVKDEIFPGFSVEDNKPECIQMVRRRYWKYKNKL